MQTQDSKISITEFTVKGLHGDLTVRIPIKDNKMILVGVNGIGKSTVIVLLYYTLSRQWTRLAEYNFASISIRINGRRIVVEKEHILAFNRSRNALHHYTYRYSFEHVADRMLTMVGDDLRAFTDITVELTPAQTKRIADQLRIPASALRRIRQELIGDTSLWRDVNANPIQEVDKRLSDLIGEQIIFLPTYRRIEKELEAIVPELREEVRRYNERRQKEGPKPGRGYLELVQFGMEDIDQSINRALVELRETARSELNNLAGAYLRDVIRHEANRYDPTTIAALNEPAVTRIVNRVEEKTLDPDEKIRLRDAIGRLRGLDDSSVTDEDRYVAHFFLQLAKIDEVLSKQEEPVKRFVGVCNAYLTGKQIVYDEVNFRLSIESEANRKKGEAITWSMLSSGEKQIVSIFAHLYFNIKEKFIVIIDEPELSLSVDWQEQLLPDIEATGKVTMIAAVTHSPFIFSNKMKPYAADLRKFIT